MNDEPINLDMRRGMTAQKETDIRRRLSEVRADQAALKLRQDEFENLLEAVPATSQQEAVIKAKYLIQLYAGTQDGSHPLRARLINRSLEDLDRFFNLECPPNAE
jgi:hypothetical protein